MSERENIFGRIREALRTRAPKPGDHGHGTDNRQHRPEPTAGPAARQWLPPVGDTFEQRIQLFQTHAAELKSDFYLVNGQDAIIETLAKICALEQWQRAASHEGQLSSIACERLGIPILATDRPYDVNILESCDAGITECDALVAQTGSVLVSSRSSGGRAVSVLPPHHVVLARREQLLPDLPAAFEWVQRKYGGNYPSFISLITGPSRTGDIERILVLGAHGPKRLTIICG